MLFGECTLLVDGEERLLRAWDFFHCPAGTASTSSSAPAMVTCALVMAGARDNEQLHYPVSELAARYGGERARRRRTTRSRGLRGLGAGRAGAARVLGQLSLGQAS